MTMMRFKTVGALTVLSLMACGGGASATGSGSAGEGETQGEADAGESGSEGESGGSGEDGGDFEWSFLDEYELRIDDSPTPPLMLEMDQDEVAELFGSVADEILLLELDSTPLLVNALDEIKSACGLDWQNDKASPDYDCSTTTLGQTFVGPDGTWQTSAEFSAIRILTMTPANARVVGTSIEGTQELADALNIGGGFSQILSDSMQISRTTEFLGTQALAQALRQNVIGTHPNLDMTGTLPVTLADALANMSTLSDKFGPVGNHPGVLDPSMPPYGEMFGPDFKMSAVAESNLKVLDGADLGVSKDFITVVQDLVGPTFDDPAEFDFEDPEKFSVTGLAPDPVVDLRFNVVEHPTFVGSCVGDDNCVNNLPGNPVGTGSVWNTNPWTLEYQVATAGILTYDQLVHQQCYPAEWLCTAEVKVGQDPFPAGYTEFDVFLNLGNPPENQYMWELINEVAQVQFHDNGYVQIPEGQGDIAFTLQDIAVGITGEEAAEAVRPYLAEQSGEIAGYLLGDYKKNNGDVDFYYRRADNGTPYLYFVAPDDLDVDKPYGWQKPGFFGSAYLDEDSRLSSTQVDGVADTTHEKWAPPPGVSTAFVQDDEGIVYRLTFVVPESGDPTEIVVGIERRVD
jgi:hypothetical protein